MGELERPLFPCCSRTEPGAQGDREERRPMASVAQEAFICILPEAPGGPRICAGGQQMAAPGLSRGGAGTPRPSSDGSGASLLCNCFTASAM